MIVETHGNLLTAEAEALVNTVNTVGVMGKGIALQFKRAFPDNFAAYEQACKDGKLEPGQMLVFQPGLLNGPRFIINFPTKRHWRGSARLEDIDSGLRALIDEVKRLRIRSIAVPPLGCGNGGLDWRDVKPRIVEAFQVVPDVRVLLFAPGEAPAPSEMTVKTPRPRMTPAVAATVGIMGRYAQFDYRLTLLEVQKLVYFLKESGEELARTKFEKGTYGPYADNLRHVLNRLEGHYIQGFGDATKNQPDTPVWLLPDATAEAEAFLEQKPDTLARFERVAELIDGLETPHGLELLSSVHWVATRENAAAKTDFAAAAAGVRAWSPRKAGRFKEAHLRLAWDRLRSQGWI